MIRIPGLATLKTWALAALGAITLVLFAVMKGKDAARAKADQKRAEKARETEQQATDAMVEGLEREQEKADEATAKVDSGDYSHFER
jgi:hypothetical protein